MFSAGAEGDTRGFRQLHPIVVPPSYFFGAGVIWTAATRQSMVTIFRACALRPDDGAHRAGLIYMKPTSTSRMKVTVCMSGRFSRLRVSGRAAEVTEGHPGEVYSIVEDCSLGRSARWAGRHPRVSRDERLMSTTIISQAQTHSTTNAMPMGLK
jgi:hypothetical protein